MRTAITIGYEHGGKKSSVIIGPEVDLGTHVSKFKALPGDRSPNEKFEKIELWESSSGVIKSRKFLSLKAHKEREEAIQKQQEEFEEAQKPKDEKSKPKSK